MLGFSKCKYTKKITNRNILHNKTPSDCRHPAARQTCQPLNFIQKKNIPFSGDTELTSQGRSFPLFIPFIFARFSYALVQYMTDFCQTFSLSFYSPLRYRRATGSSSSSGRYERVFSVTTLRYACTVLLIFSLFEAVKISLI